VTNDDKNDSVQEFLKKVIVDPRIELIASSPAFLIGYKMAYVVDENRKKIPNVIAIVTLKIPQNANQIFASERNGPYKTFSDIRELSKKYNYNEYVNEYKKKNSSSENYFLWEHSKKYCAHTVEPLGLTMCGNLDNLLIASKKYEDNYAFIESAYTYEENKKPVVYEVGDTLMSVNDKPTYGNGGCYDYFHFFLAPEYALDYGYWQFQYQNKEGYQKRDINDNIFFGKQLKDIRRLNDVIDEYNMKNRKNVKLIEKNGKYISSQIDINETIAKNLEESESIGKKYEDILFQTMV
jgi:hypothetical protein